MNKKILTIMTLLLLLLTSNIYSKPRIEFINNPRVGYFPKVAQTQIRFDANNIDTWIQNTGIFDQDIRTNNTPGLMWKKGSNRFAIFTAGLSIGTKIDGQYRLASASYKGEYAPSTIPSLGGDPITNSDFKLYKVTIDDSTSQDYLNWGKMVPYGAPYVDRNNNGQWDPGIDRPGIKDALQTIFVCMTDGYPENHTQSEGFSGGTAPIKSEMRLTAWAYGDDGINDINFLSFTVINKNNKAWNNTFFGFVVDPDLGDGNDDYIGCDTAINLAYCYNSDNMDGNGNPPSYGANPPASGMDFFLSPIIPTGNNNDSIYYYDPPGSNNRVVKRGFRELGMTSFVYFTNPSSGDLVCEQDPQLPEEAYRYLTGIKKDGSSWFHPATKQRANKLYPGDPDKFTGWSERGYNGNQNQARIKNCVGGDTNAVYPSVGGDRRFIFNSGDANFTVNPGDTQRIVLAQMVARGTNNFNSVTRLKAVDVAAQALYRVNFVKPPDIPLPKTNISIVDKGNGRCNIMLSWDDKAERYSIWDSLTQPAYDTSFWKFEGYEIYQIKDKNQPIPDFYAPETMNDNIRLLKIYDIVDSIGQINDYVSTPAGEVILPVVPPYLMNSPEGFPNTGINRSHLLTTTSYPDLQSNEANFVYGRTYYFAVIAYAYKTNPYTIHGNYRRVKRNPISVNTIITIRPETPLAGSVFTYKNSDTISTNRRDLGVAPVIVNQNALLDAKYRVVFSNMSPNGTPNDTTYSILRSMDNGQNWDTLKKFLKYTSTNTQDSSRIIDGVLIQVKKIKIENSLPYNAFLSNVGVIKDPIPSTRNFDSIQARLPGWDYLRNGNPVKVFTGSNYKPRNMPYQSASMSLSYPTNGTFSNGRSQLRPDQLRKVKIIFSDLNGGQFAYRYYNQDPNFKYWDTVKVPFTVWMADSTTNDMRQLNCALVVDTSAAGVSTFVPSADSLGKKLLVYIFNSNYDAGNTSVPYKTRDLFLFSSLIDIMYVWAPRLASDGQTFSSGDVLTIYPYTTTRPFFSGTIPLWYDFETKKPTISLDVAKNNMDKIRVVPNPYYGYNDLETSTINRFITFRNLPAQCDIKIYTLDGVMIKHITKDTQDPTITWDLKNTERIPIASGMYIALINVGGAQKVIKLAVFMPEERIDVR